MPDWGEYSTGLPSGPTLQSQPWSSRAHAHVCSSQVLAVSRIMVAWQPVGMAMGAYDMCVRYLGQRQQFGAPLSAFQLSQDKLARMLGNIQVTLTCGLHLAARKVKLPTHDRYGTVSVAVPC